MARTTNTGGGNNCAPVAHPFTANSHPNTSSLLASNELVEIRLGGTKVVLCPPLSGEEDEDKRAMIFYTVNAALMATASTIKHRARLIALGNHIRLGTIVNLILERIDSIYDEQKWDPSLAGPL